MSDGAESSTPKRSLWPVVATISNLFAQAYMLARTRAASHPSPIVRLMAGRDHLNWEGRLLEREAAVLRGQRAEMNPHKRPEYNATHRAEVLQVMALRGWSVSQAAERFVIHPNTIRAWQKAAEGGARSDRLLGRVPWNKLHDAVRWLVHEIRRLCPEKEFGTRLIARHIVRAGIRISSSTVRRVLDEEQPKPDNGTNLPTQMPLGRGPNGFLKPTEPNRVWHCDLTVIQLLWMRLSVAAIVDGFSRKILALRAYRGAPTSREMARLLGHTSKRYGRPRFLITDHGCQFQKRFRRRMKAMGIGHIRGRIRSFGMNGKIERLFRTFKLWQRVSLIMLGDRARQRQLEGFRVWYNCHRPHSRLGGRTPREMWSGVKVKEPRLVLARGEVEPRIRIKRNHVRGDPRLPVIEIDVALRHAA